MAALAGADPPAFSETTQQPPTVLSGTDFESTRCRFTGIWLMYCTYAMTLDLALGAKAWI
jgi:hypothetical protein